MKTILIVYLATVINGIVNYPSILVYGQTDNTPEITFIGAYSLVESNYFKLMDFCEDKFCQYFNTDNNNLVHIINSI